MKHIYILYGAPGSGKGTMVEKISDYIALKGDRLLLFETGQAMRDFSTHSKTAIGEIIKEYQSKGSSLPGVIPGYFWIHMLMNMKQEHSENTIAVLEGVIRTQEEGIFFAQLASVLSVPVTIFELASDDEVCIRRLSSRGRYDDITEEVIANRLRTYRTSTTDAMNNLLSKLQLLQVKAQLVTIDASLDGPENVWSQMKNYME